MCVSVLCCLLYTSFFKKHRKTHNDGVFDVYTPCLLYTSNAESPALENISFTVHHGETLTIMGDIGSGKSTITNLIPRLFAIESGGILFKGKSIYEWNVDDLRAHIGYVPQKAYLFTGTIDMNVRYGAASGQVLSVEDVENACHLAKADEFIKMCIRDRFCIHHENILLS